jgi:taurine transport system permease protein
MLTYLGLFLGSWSVLRMLSPRKPRPVFGDIAAIRPNRWAQVLSIIAVLAIWGDFTGSRLVPLHVPGPFLGQTGFDYGTNGPDGAAEGRVTIIVHRPEDKPDPLSLPVGKTVFATPAWRSTLIRPTDKDTPGTQIVTVEGLPISPGQSAPVPHGHVVLTPTGGALIHPRSRLANGTDLAARARGSGSAFLGDRPERIPEHALWEHLGYSLLRVLAGLVLGALVGIPLGVQSRHLVDRVEDESIWL